MLVRRSTRLCFLTTCTNSRGGSSVVKASTRARTLAAATHWTLGPQVRFGASFSRNSNNRADSKSPTTAPSSDPASSPLHHQPPPAQPPPSTGAPRLIRHQPIPHTSHDGLPPSLRDLATSSSFYPAPHYYTPPSPLGASVLIAKHRAARRNRSRFDSLPLFQFRSSLAEVDFDSPSGWSAHNSIGWQLHQRLQHQQQQEQQKSSQQNIGSDSNTSSSTQIDPTSSPVTSSSLGSMSSSQAQSSAIGVDSKSQQLNKRTSGHDHEHSHGHSHGILGHSHDHSHAHGSPEEADRLIEALKGKGDRGSNITLLGLFSNIVLCVSKGIAGMWLNSASLVADAAHSLSDMFSDLVTLFCWKMSQKPPSRTHPLGYGKYETMGGLGVSVVLVGGSVGIGMHSWSLLLEALHPMIETAPVWIQQIGHWTGSIASMGGGHSHEVATGEDGVLDPNAMWFALLSVLVKEWLYYATLKIAKEENSSVLEANALHHRSDSLSSGVTFVAIGGSWLGLPILDPLGGLLVAALIGKQGFELMISALGELSDRGVDLDTLSDFESAMNTIQSSNALLVGWKDLRAIKSGVSTFVDITLIMDGGVTLSQAREVEDQVRNVLVESHKGVKEVRVHMAPAQH
ncbi:unnamed protein product [Sympodiomycopsis kandeliae]